MITSPDSVYSLPPEEIITDLTKFITANYNAFPDLGFAAVPNPESLSNLSSQNRVQIRIVKTKRIRPGARTEALRWTLASLWFDGEPCGVLRHVAANDLSDDRFPQRFITDWELYERLIKYLFSLLVSEKSGAEELETPVFHLFSQMFAGEILLSPPSIQRVSFNEADFLTAMDYTLKYS